MAYSTVVKVRSVLSGEDDEEGGTAASLSDAQIQYEIDGARATIDAALHGVYKLPFDLNDTGNTTATVPQIIINICTDIAAYMSDLNYRKGREYDNQNMPVPLRYQRAQTLLENLRTGTITIDWPHADSDGSGAGVVHQYSPALMTFEDVFCAPYISETYYPFDERGW
jgi:phage gp36-like protein